MKRILILIVPVILCGCAVQRQLEHTEVHQEHSAHEQEAVRWLQRLDSVFVHDSIYVRERSDTIFIDRWHTQYRDRQLLIHDTLCVRDTVLRGDTLRVVETKVQTERYVPRFYKTCTILFWLVVVGVVVVVLWRIFKRYYLHL